MGCYTVPLIAAIAHFFMRKRDKKFQTANHKMLNLLFAGGAIFGVVDHAWNGELLAFSLQDMLLGFVITASIMVIWTIMIAAQKSPVTAKA